MQRQKALLIEDSPEWLSYFKEVIVDSPSNTMDFAYASNLTDGLLLISKYDPDVIILDLMLPETQGIETVKRTVAVAGQTPVVILTTLDENIMADVSIACGATDYLVKDQYNEVVFFHTVRQAILRTISNYNKDLALLRNSLERLQTSLQALDQQIDVSATVNP